MDALVPYELPAEVLHTLIEVARTSEVLLFGELHGTQEVPRLVLALLPGLTMAGYRGLALEIPHPDREALAGWGAAQHSGVPDFLRIRWLMVEGIARCLRSLSTSFSLRKSGTCFALIKALSKRSSGGLIVMAGWLTILRSNGSSCVRQ